MSMRFRPRRGMGALLAFVMIVLLVVGIMGFSSHFQAAGTGRTMRRVLDVRTSIEAGESAIGEAVTYLKASLDTGATSPFCADDWRTMMLTALQTPGSLPKGYRVVPDATQKAFSKQGIGILDVTVDTIDLYMPPDATGELPQGVLEFSTRVSTAEHVFGVVKTIRQRRSFHVLAPLLPGGVIDSANATFRLARNPLGMVIDQQ